MLFHLQQNKLFSFFCSVLYHLISINLDTRNYHSNRNFVSWNCCMLLTHVWNYSLFLVSRNIWLLSLYHNGKIVWNLWNGNARYFYTCKVADNLMRLKLHDIWDTELWLHFSKIDKKVDSYSLNFSHDFVLWSIWNFIQDLISKCITLIERY